MWGHLLCLRMSLGSFFPFAGLFISQISEIFLRRTFPYVFLLKPVRICGNPVRSPVRMVMMQLYLRGKLCIVIPEVKVPIPQRTSQLSRYLQFRTPQRRPSAFSRSPNQRMGSCPCETIIATRGPSQTFALPLTDLEISERLHWLPKMIPSIRSLL